MLNAFVGGDSGLMKINSSRLSEIAELKCGLTSYIKIFDGYTEYNDISFPAPQTVMPDTCYIKEAYVVFQSGYFGMDYSQSHSFEATCNGKKLSYFSLSGNSSLVHYVTLDLPTGLISKTEQIKIGVKKYPIILKSTATASDYYYYLPPPVIYIDYTDEKPEDDGNELIASPEKDQIFYIESTPTMPDDILYKIKEDTTYQTCSIGWEIKVKYNIPSEKNAKYSNVVTTKILKTYEESVNGFNLPFNDFFIGGDLIVNAYILDDEYNVLLQDSVCCDIHGKNPPISSIMDNLAISQKAMVWTESPSLQQFYYEGSYGQGVAGRPLIGYDNHGVGLCQIDGRYHNIDTDILWNWKKNLEYGIDYFDQCRVQAISYIKKQISNAKKIDKWVLYEFSQVPNYVIHYEAYAKYNSGPDDHYFVFEYSNDTFDYEWIPLPSRKKLKANMERSGGGYIDKYQVLYTGVGWKPW